MKCVLCEQLAAFSFTFTFLFSFQSFPESIICKECSDKLEPLKESTTCSGCCRKQAEATFCEDCKKWQRMYPEYLFQHIALYRYNDEMKQWLERYKFKGDVRLGRAFTEELKATLHPFLREKWLVSPIPVQQKRLNERGFNQVEEILKYAAIPYELLLFNMTSGQKQSEKDRKSRMTSPQPFQLIDNKKLAIQNKRIVLVDDVYTTGRTLFHAAEVLLENGAAKVQTISIAR